MKLPLPSPYSVVVVVFCAVALLWAQAIGFLFIANVIVRPWIKNIVIESIHEAGIDLTKPVEDVPMDLKAPITAKAK